MAVTKSIRVRSTDQNGLYFEKMFTITITDQVVDGAPSVPVLTVLSDTSIKFDWTIGSTNHEGHSIERSTNGIDYTEIDTVTGGTATFTDTGLTANTRYYYRARAYMGTEYSTYTDAVNDWTAIKMILTSTGTGAGVSTCRFWFATTNVVVTLDGNGRWYSNSGGTADESTSYTFVAGALRTRYLKVTSGASNMLIFAKGNWLEWGNDDLEGWISSTNAATIAADISSFTSLTNLYVLGANTLSGSIAALTSIVLLIVLSNNTLTGSIAALTSLAFLRVTGTNTISGDIGGIGTNAVVNGITTLLLTVCAMTVYTEGATWSLTASSTISPSVGYGYSATEIDNMLIDMAASLGTVTAKTITLKGSSAARTSASDAAVATLNGKGWTVVTN